MISGFLIGLFIYLLLQLPEWFLKPLADQFWFRIVDWAIEINAIIMLLTVSMFWAAQGKKWWLVLTFWSLFHLFIGIPVKASSQQLEDGR